MSIQPGTRLGPYEVSAAIGAGGMGEVYRARDTALNRDVAIKVLSEALASDADRLVRFQREAESLAALNHPNIAQIYGLENGGETPALVLELVEGPTLAERIEAGPIPLDEALPIARQIAEALEAAHERGIIHRDLKPANVKVREDGTVKVLDFGLAKAAEPTGDSSANMANSPTLTARATQMGMILGTAAYMAPEQARGRSVDKRADIWAFGVVLLEMLSGRRVFGGDEIADVLAAVLRQEIDWSTLPPDTPLSLRHLIERCLDRDPKARLRDIGEARVTLVTLEAGVPDQVSATASSDSVAGPPPRWRLRLPWLAVGALAAGLAGVVFLWGPWREAPAGAPVRLLANIGAEASIEEGSGVDAMAISPDGTQLAFVAQKDGVTRLFVRRLDQLQAIALTGTENAALPFFSPDGLWLAFFAEGKLRKVPVTGGAAVTLADAANPRGGAWLEDETIVFTPDTVSSNVSQSRLMRYPSASGAPEVFVELGEGAQTQRWPQALPGGEAVLYTEHSSGGAFDGANLVVVPTAGGAPTIVVKGAYHGRYAPSGHLLYMSQGILYAVRFDLDRLETSGLAVPVFEGVSATSGTGAAQFALSASGTLVYVPGQSSGSEIPIDWLTESGETSVLREERAAWKSPRFSPDGQRLATDLSEDGNPREIAVYDLGRDTLSQLTFDPGDDVGPQWTPDGKRVTFASDRDATGVHNLYWLDADGSGNLERLTTSPLDQRAGSWHPSGRYLAFTERSETTGQWDIKILPMDGDETLGWTPGTPTDFLNTQAHEVYPVFSPDGRWIANASNENGPYEISVRPFPGPGGKWLISAAGGQFPRWSPTRPELLFANQNQIFSAPYAVAGDSFVPDREHPWSPTGYEPIGTAFPYDIHPDGQRLALLARDEQTDVIRDSVVVIVNFADHLTTIVPEGR